MTDRAFEPTNVFDQFDPDKVEAGAGALARPPAINKDNPFEQFNPFPGEETRPPIPPKTSAAGTFLHAAERGVVPAAGGLAAAGVGAEFGAALGTLGGPFAPITVPVGGFLGGAGAFYFGAEATARAQDWALSKLPDSWREALGQDERRQQLEEAQHPTAAFLGGLAPYALTLRPSGWTTKAAGLPDNATAFQRIMANPVTSRLFAGTLMGGMELGQEAIQGQSPNWSNIAIATGFGLVFNKPTALGERLTEVGARPARALLGRPEPTVTQAGDLNAAGPGVTEEVHQGSHERDPAATLRAQEDARQEQAILGEPPAPDPHAIARRMEPDTFAVYDELTARRAALRTWVDTLGGSEQAYAHLRTTEQELAALEPQVQAAYRRAAEASGAQTVAPPNTPAEPTAPVPDSILSAFPDMRPAEGGGISLNGFTTEEREALRHAGLVEKFKTDAGAEYEGIDPEKLWPLRRGRQTGRLKPFEAAAAPELAPAGPLDILSGPAEATATAQGEIATPQAAAAPPAPPSLDAQRAFIVADVARQLEAAGRPAEEAQAAAQLIAARYLARAEWFKGALGSPQALYEREGAVIRRTGTATPSWAAGAPRGPRARPQRTWSLLEWLVAKGGLKPDADLRALVGTENKTIPGFGNLLKPDGMSMDEALQAAKDGGYLIDPAELAGREQTIGHEDLRQAIDRELRGEKQYRAGFTPEDRAAAERQADEYAHREEEAEPARRVAPKPEPEFAASEFFQREQAPVFYSAVERAIESSKQERAPAAHWLGTIKNLPGIKAEELQWLGLEDWLREQKGPVTRQQIVDYVRANRIEVKEVLRGEADPTLQRLHEISQRFSEIQDEFNRLHERPDSAVVAKRKQELANEKAALYEEHTRLMDIERAAAPRYGQYALPGGENYRELLLTLPTEVRDLTDLHARQNDLIRERESLAAQGALLRGHPDHEWAIRRYQQINALVAGISEEILRAKGATFKSPHWDEPNVLAHIRFDDRTGPNGEKILHIAEVQSDWHQKGRKEGYGLQITPQAQALMPEIRALGIKAEANEISPKMIEDAGGNHDLVVNWWDLVHNREVVVSKGPPDAPFKTSWPELALKRMIRYAAEHGYERLSWDTGATNAERYDLSKQVERVLYRPETKQLIAWRKGAGEDAEPLFERRAEPNELPDIIGKEAADRLIEKKQDLSGAHILSGLDLKIGGEGMVGFYDRILPAAANKLVKKFGAKVEESAVDVGGKKWQPFERPDGQWGLRASDDGYESSLTFPTKEAAAAEVEHAGHPAHSLAITPQLAEAALGEGFPLFQSARGKIRFAEGHPPVITLMRDANASTFIHESGHDFLEQLMRDAEHELAPEQLRTDAATVRDWLGAKPDTDITVRQHEKFARGFEQYVREGVAPSKELASVFAKFKQWLVGIYQTLKGLGMPISEDIRAVFDRMLATEPARTVIAPERMPQPSLADIHATDAAETLPHEAEARGLLVEAEADRYTAEPPPDIAHEIATAEAKRQERAAAAEPPGQAGGGSSQAGPVPGTGERPGVEPEGGGVGGGRGAELRGSGEPLPEGAGAAGTEPAGPGAGESAGHSPLAPGPAADLGRTQSRLIGKAGNVRPENITSVDDFVRAIDESSERIAEAGNVTGRATMGQMVDLADTIGIDPHRITETRLGEIFGGVANLAPKIWALRQAIRDSAQIVSDLAKRYAETNADADLAAGLAAMARHDMMQSVLSGVTTETGRGLGMAFRNLEGWQKAEDLGAFLEQNTGRTLFQLKQIAKMTSRLDSPGKISKFLREAQQRSAAGMLLEYWINGLISGPATHTTYTVGNMILSLEKAGPETATAAALGALRQALGREGERVRLGEVGAQLGKAASELPRALSAALEGFRSGMTTLLPGEEGRVLTPFQGDQVLKVARTITSDPVGWRDVGAELFGSVRGIFDGLRAGAELIAASGEKGAPLLGWHFSPLGQIPDLAIRGVPAVPLGSAVRLPGRFIAAIHSFFRTTNYSMEGGAQAYRAAAEAGLAGTAFDAEVARIYHNPTPEQMEARRFIATELTLMGQGGAITQALTRLTNARVNLPFAGEVAILKFIDPFVHISSNIIRQTIVERSPAGLLSAEIRADLMGKNGNVAQDTAMARMLCGTLLSIGFGSLAASGYASGSGPKDPKEAAMWRLAGNQAHSVRVGDIWYDVHRLGPMGMLTAIAADLYEVADKAVNEGEYVEAAAHLQHAITQNILDESFMRGPADLIKAVEDPGRYGERYIRDWLSSFVPYSVGMAQVARAMDPYSRQARSVVDAIKLKIPGLSQSLLPRRDIWGEPMPSRDALIVPGVTAIYETRMSRDPVNLAMLDLGISPGPPPRKIRNVDLTDEQYDDFARIAGRMTKLRLDAIVRSPDYRLWPNHVRHDVIAETIRQSREAARGILMMKFPQIIRDATAAKLERLED